MKDKKNIIIAVCVAVILVVIGAAAIKVCSNLGKKMVPKDVVSYAELESSEEYYDESTEQEAEYGVIEESLEYELTEEYTGIEESSESEDYSDIAEYMDEVRHQAVDVILENTGIANECAAEIGVSGVDWNSPLSYNATSAVYTGTCNGEQVQFQIMVFDGVIDSAEILASEDERPVWLPEGDSDRSDNLVIEEVGNMKFDMTYEQHAEMFESMVYDFGYEDPEDDTIYVTMIDGDGYITLDIFNTSSKIYVKDDGDVFTAWCDDDTAVRYFSKTQPYNRVE